MMKQIQYLPIFVLSATLASCGGGGSGGSGSSAGSNNPQGFLNIDLTDAPVDNVQNVYIKFTGVEIKPASGASLQFDFPSAKSIDVLALQNGDTEPLLDNVKLDAGEYNWIRLKVAAEQGKDDSYLIAGDAVRSLHIPSGSESGLKLNRGFTVAEGGTVDFTIDFDLRKSIVAPNGQDDVFLKPVLRIVDNLEVGTLKVDLLIADAQNKGCVTPALYLFDGNNVVPKDIANKDTDPLVTRFFQEGATYYSVKIQYLEAGTYTAAIACNSTIDNPDTVENFLFMGTGTVQIDVDKTSDTFYNSNSGLIEKK